MANPTVSAAYEHIIVGGGSAGCVVAARLAAAGRSVLLLEAGPGDDTPFIHMPGAFIRLFGTERVVNYQTTPQPGAAGRPLFVPQANTLGGGSSVNAMIYIRGTREDFDAWQALGCDGWGWDRILPLFKKSEGNQVFSQPYHGTDGPLKVGNAWFSHPASLAFIKAGQEIGLPYNHDFNGAQQQGVGYFQSTTDQARRCSAAVAYLAPLQGHKTLTVRTRCRVLRLLIEDRQVTGVVYRGRDGKHIEVRARREVVLAAGALVSPKLLQLSGIGPAALLRRHGIAVLHDAPEVGENFQNHVEVPIYGRLKQPISLLGQDQGAAAIKLGLHYLLFRSGMLATSIVEAGAFIDSAGSDRPDIQLYLIPSLFGSGEWPAPAGHGVSICTSLLRPKSRGSVRVSSADADQPILFDAGALTQQEDIDCLVRGIAVTRQMLSAPSFARIVSHEVFASPEGEADARDADAYVRKYARPISHVAGTCRMGSDEGAVVDPKLKVRGVDRLRVADNSIIPQLPSGNTNSVAILIGERCAEFMLQDA